MREKRTAPSAPPTTRHNDRAEQHATSCGLLILAAYQEIDEARAAQPKGSKKAVMGKGEWLKLAGISPQRCAEYRAIATGETTMQDIRAGAAERVSEHRARPNVPLRNGQNGQQPRQLSQPPRGTPTYKDPAGRKYPEGTAGTVALFVSDLVTDKPVEVWPYLVDAVMSGEMR